MKVRFSNALSVFMVIGSLLLAVAAPYDEPDLDGPSALFGALTHTSFSIAVTLYVTLVLAWGAIVLWQRRMATFA